MSAANVYEDLNMRYSKAGGEDGGGRVDIYEGGGALPDRSGPEAGTRRAGGAWLRAALLVLGVLSFLLLVGVLVLATLVSCPGSVNAAWLRSNRLLLPGFSIARDKNQLSHRYQDLQARSENLSRDPCWSPGDEHHADGGDGGGGGTRWTRFRCSCYYKSTSVRNWTSSRDDCLSRGADLVVINDVHEDKFVRKLNQDAASWIGLRMTRSWTTWKPDWTWVDGSVPSYWGWSSGLSPESPEGSTAYIDHLRTWNYSQTGSRGWICEKALP